MRTGLIALAGIILFGICASAQVQGKPDLSGSWNLPYTPNMAKDIGDLPY
jgi:hypothetical protein